MAETKSGATPVFVPGAASIAHEDGSTVVYLEGEHNMASVQALSATLATAMACDAANVMIDLGKVVFMDATTIGAIMRARLLLGLQSRSLVLRGPTALVRRLLVHCGLAWLVQPG